MNKELFYLDTYTLQQDMRIRLPKALLNNMPIEKGKTKLDLYLDKEKNEIIMRVHADKQKGENK